MPKNNTYCFSDFVTGDTVIFRKSFSRQEFEAFSQLSGDRNALHHDAEFSASTNFGKPIVPLHMTLAPLSRIAGMNFPGEPSLYLGHDVRAARAVHYDEELTYSARVMSVSPATRTLSLRVIALCRTEIVLEGSMMVQALAEAWPTAPELDILRANRQRKVILTGATGAIGSAIAERLAADGAHILAITRDENAKREQLGNRVAAATRQGAKLEFITADLARPASVAQACEQIAAQGDADILIHAASAPIHAALGDLVQTNFEAMRLIAEAMLPGMLARQDGAIAFVSSVAALNRVPGWEAYSGAKVMGSNYVQQFDTAYGSFGVRGLNCFAGLVDTPFSDTVAGTTFSMSPAEVADHLLEAVRDTDGLDSGIIVEAGKAVRHGSLRFGGEATARPLASFPEESLGTVAAQDAPVADNGSGVEQRLERVLIRTLGIPSLGHRESAGIGVTPGWDSLRQIEIVLATEQEFAIRFRSNEIGELQSFQALCLRLQNRVYQQ